MRVHTAADLFSCGIVIMHLLANPYSADDGHGWKGAQTDKTQQDYEFVTSPKSGSPKSSYFETACADWPELFNDLSADAKEVLTILLSVKKEHRAGDHFERNVGPLTSDDPGFDVDQAADCRPVEVSISSERQDSEMAQLQASTWANAATRILKLNWFKASEDEDQEKAIRACAYACMRACMCACMWCSHVSH